MTDQINSGDFLKKAILFLVVLLVITLPQWVEEMINGVSNFIQKLIEALEKLYYVFSKIINLLNVIEVGETGSYNNSGKT